MKLREELGRMLVAPVNAKDSDNPIDSFFLLMEILDRRLDEIDDRLARLERSEAVTQPNIIRKDP